MEQRQESLKDWYLEEVKRISEDEDATTKQGRKLTKVQRNIKAIGWAWKFVFGDAQDIDASTLVEFLNTLGSPLKVSRWFLRKAENFPEGEDLKHILLAQLKAHLKAQGAPVRVGVGEGPDVQYRSPYVRRNDADKS